MKPGDRLNEKLPPVEGIPNGHAWNGFEFVSPERYEEQRLSTMPELPPLQPVPHGAGAGAHSGKRGPQGYTGAHVPAPLAALYREGMLAAMSFKIDAAEMLLRGIEGETPEREGLAETPERFAKAWTEWTSGYGKDPAAILKVFEDGAEGCDEMVVVADIPFYSKCEHHLADIFGTATVAYIPDGRIVGLSKLPRLVDIYARRLQVQERMTNQVAEALMEHLKPRGCGVVVKARHMCMESRGIKQAGGYTTTSALRGVFKDDPAVRAEFLSLTR